MRLPKVHRLRLHKSGLPESERYQIMAQHKLLTLTSDDAFYYDGGEHHTTPPGTTGSYKDFGSTSVGRREDTMSQIDVARQNVIRQLILHPTVFACPHTNMRAWTRLSYDVLESHSERGRS
jgi:hypothetical protein